MCSAAFWSKYFLKILLKDDTFIDSGWLVWFGAIVVVFVSVVDSEVEDIVVGWVVVSAVDTSAVVDVDVFICWLVVDFVSCWNCFVEFSESKKVFFQLKTVYAKNR